MDPFYSLLFIILLIFIGSLCWQLSLNKQEESIKKDREKAQIIIMKERENFEKSIEAERIRIRAEMQSERNEMLQEVSTIRNEALSSVRIERDAVNQAERNLQAITKETRQKHPELAKQIADAQYYLDMRSYNQLLHQKRPALKAAEEVKKIAGEKRELMKENRQLQYQLDFYEKLFPWLEEFKEVPSDEAISYATDAYGFEYDAVRKWLSPEEYERLSNADKYQLALDRWKNRKKEDWDVGIEYERYIGYKLECDGYKVTYLGATLGLKDMGRDLLATKGGKTLVIQCKRWAKEKTIHEKHIFQLYGSTAVLATEHPGTTYKAVFITTATLSDTARKCAEYCGISIVENCPIGDYPLIKCNANKDGEKYIISPSISNMTKWSFLRISNHVMLGLRKKLKKKGFAVRIVGTQINPNLRPAHAGRSFFTSMGAICSTATMTTSISGAKRKTFTFKEL